MAFGRDPYPESLACIEFYVIEQYMVKDFAKGLNSVSVTSNTHIICKLIYD